MSTLWGFRTMPISVRGHALCAYYSKVREGIVLR
jgi:hypothetical protein